MFLYMFGPFSAGIDPGTRREGSPSTPGVRMRCWRSRLGEAWPGDLVLPQA